MDKDKSAWNRLYLLQGIGGVLGWLIMLLYFDRKDEMFLVFGMLVFLVFSLAGWAAFERKKRG